MPAVNKELARIFKEISACYRFLGPEYRFRAIAYQNAYRVLSSMQEDIRKYNSMKELEKLRGIGHGIAEKIMEYLEKGKVSRHEELKKKAPYGLIELLDVAGFGPETLKLIHHKLGVKTVPQLKKALKEGKVEKLKGLGPKKVSKMLKGLDMYKAVEERILLWDGLEIGKRLLGKMEQFPEVKKVELAGSLRRKKETIRDIDILVSSTKNNRKKIIDAFTQLDEVKEVLIKGPTKASVIIEDRHRGVDLRILNPSEWGAALQYFTGSKSHNVHFRKIAREKGIKVSEYGVFKGKKKIAGKTEEDVYNALNCQWMPPEMREDNGEIELGLENKIPPLVTMKDIKGDLQMHSVWSDGNADIEEMASYLMDHFHYEYMAITDHSKAVRVAGGMDEKGFGKQMKEIDKINSRLGRNFVKKGAEVDILANGNLDLSDELLSQLDWVVASIHSNINRDNTDRIIKACENPNVCVIGHPTGRIIGVREGYPLNLDEVLTAAKETGTALEINAYSNRLDLNDAAARAAREKGVKLVISTDSHHTGDLQYMELGVYVARRGWCTKSDILNTKSWKGIQAFVNKKRKLQEAGV